MCPWPPHSKKSTLSLKERVLPESMGDLSLANPLATPQLDTALCSQVREPDSRPKHLSHPRDCVVGPHTGCCWATASGVSVPCLLPVSLRSLP